MPFQDLKEDSCACHLPHRLPREERARRTVLVPHTCHTNPCSCLMADFPHLPHETHAQPRPDVRYLTPATRIHHPARPREPAYTSGALRLPRQTHRLSASTPPTIPRACHSKRPRRIHDRDAKPTVRHFHTVTFGTNPDGTAIANTRERSRMLPTLGREHGPTLRPHFQTRTLRYAFGGGNNALR